MSAANLPTHKNFCDLTGKVFSRLTVVSFAGWKRYPTKNRPLWNCLCVCGKELEVVASSLRSGHTTSCRCVRITHGASTTDEYAVWWAMVQRCTDESCEAYKWYGERGITVCERWLKFENFFEDMGTRPVGLSIDRIDNALGYFKENCRWATRVEQGRNKRTNRLIEIDGSVKCVSEWCELIGISSSLYCERTKRLGWTDREAILTPSGSPRPR